MHRNACHRHRRRRSLNACRRTPKRFKYKRFKQQRCVQCTSSCLPVLPSGRQPCVHPLPSCTSRCVKRPRLTPIFRRGGHILRSSPAERRQRPTILLAQRRATPRPVMAAVPAPRAAVICRRSRRCRRTRVFAPAVLRRRPWVAIARAVHPIPRSSFYPQLIAPALWPTLVRPKGLCQHRPDSPLSCAVPLAPVPASLLLFSMRPGRRAARDCAMLSLHIQTTRQDARSWPL